MRIILATLALGLALQASAQEESAIWSVDEDRAPYSVFEMDAREGTWVSVDVSPDGERIVFDLLGHLYEMPIQGGRAEPLTEGRSWNMFPRYAPDGSRIAFTSDRSGSNDLWILDRSTGALENVSQMELPVFQGTWSVDGRHLYGTALNMQVRFPAYQFNLFGEKQMLLPAGERTPVNHFQEHTQSGRIFFVHNEGSLPASGPKIKTYDLGTGEVEVYIDRPGGAATSRLSPDGLSLAYVHRDDKETVLIVHDLETREEKVLMRGLDTGRLESRSFYGAYPNIAWHPEGKELFLTYGGQIHAVDVLTGGSRNIEFVAPVHRKIDDTHRVGLQLPESTARTRSHRWGVPTSRGIVFEALGDLYLHRDGSSAKLTDTAAFETNPVVHESTGKLYYASWSDDDMGAVYVRDLEGGPAEKLTTRRSQYGSIAVSRDGKQVAFVRGAGSLIDGGKLERQTEFELVHLDADRRERKVTTIHWIGNRYAKRPPSVVFSEDGTRIYFTEYVDDTLTLKSVRSDGLDPLTHYRFLHATRAVLAPNLEWVVFREYHRSFVTPYAFIGQVVEVSAADGKGFTKRVDIQDGDFTEWSDDSADLYWTRGNRFFRKSLDDVIAGREARDAVALDFEFELDTPSSIIVLTGARVLTMNDSMDILNDATIVVRDNRIVAIGDVEIPEGARVIELSGRTVMPGIFDAHGHYGSPISTLNVIEQRLYGLHANLAYGVTTMYDVYGTTQKDFWVSDMLRKGEIVGPRLFSVGDPIFVTKYRTKMHRPIASLADAEEHVRFNKEHGATSVKDYSNHTRAARQQLVAAARSNGVNIVSESFADPQMNLTQLVDGFTGLEHSMGLTPLYSDVRNLFAHTNIGMTPTLIVVYNGPSGEQYFHMRERLWEDEKLSQFFPKDELVRLRRPTHLFDDDFYHVEMAKDLRRLHQRGVLLQMGAHGQMMGLGAHWEMELFVHGGFTPLEAIQIATINGFKHHGLGEVLGSIEVNKLADLVVLEANPLEDIRNTREVEYLMKNGVLYSASDAARIYPDPEPAKPLYFMK